MSDQSPVVQGGKRTGGGSSSQQRSTGGRKSKNSAVRQSQEKASPQKVEETLPEQNQISEPQFANDEGAQQAEQNVPREQQGEGEYDTGKVDDGAFEGENFAGEARFSLLQRKQEIFGILGTKDWGEGDSSALRDSGARSSRYEKIVQRLKQAQSLHDLATRYRHLRPPTETNSNGNNNNNDAPTTDLNLHLSQISHSKQQNTNAQGQILRTEELFQPSDTKRSALLRGVGELSQNSSVLQSIDFRTPDKGGAQGSAYRQGSSQADGGAAALQQQQQQQLQQQQQQQQQQLNGVGTRQSSGNRALFVVDGAKDASVSGSLVLGDGSSVARLFERARIDAMRKRIQAVSPDVHASIFDDVSTQQNRSSLAGKKSLLPRTISPQPAVGTVLQRHASPHGASLLLAARQKASDYFLSDNRRTSLPQGSDLLHQASLQQQQQSQQQQSQQQQLQQRATRASHAPSSTITAPASPFFVQESQNHVKCRTLKVNFKNYLESLGLGARTSAGGAQSGASQQQQQSSSGTSSALQSILFGVHGGGTLSPQARPTTSVYFSPTRARQVHAQQRAALTRAASPVSGRSPTHSSAFAAPNVQQLIANLYSNSSGAGTGTGTGTTASATATSPLLHGNGPVLSQSIVNDSHYSTQPGLDEILNRIDRKGRTAAQTLATNKNLRTSSQSTRNFTESLNQIRISQLQSIHSLTTRRSGLLLK